MVRIAVFDYINQPQFNIMANVERLTDGTDNDYKITMGRAYFNTMGVNTWLLVEGYDGFFVVKKVLALNAHDYVVGAERRRSRNNQSNLQTMHDMNPGDGNGGLNDETKAETID